MKKWRHSKSKFFPQGHLAKGQEPQLSPGWCCPAGLTWIALLTWAQGI